MLDAGHLRFRSREFRENEQENRWGWLVSPHVNSTQKPLAKAITPTQYRRGQSSEDVVDSATKLVSEDRLPFRRNWRRSSWLRPRSTTRQALDYGHAI